MGVPLKLKVPFKGSGRVHSIPPFKGSRKTFEGFWGVPLLIILLISNSKPTYSVPPTLNP